MDSIQNFVVNTLKIRNSQPAVQKKITIFLLASIGIFVFIGIFYIILFSATNYNQLGDLDKYIENYKKEKRTEFLDDYTLGMKIMPSYNTENNIIHMKHTKSVSFILYNFIRLTEKIKQKAKN